MYIIRDKETGTFIEEFETEQEAQEALNTYEEIDKKHEVYEEGFYEISEEELDEYYNAEMNDVLEYEARIALPTFDHE